MRVPIALQDKSWGTVQLSFKPLESSGILALLGGPIFFMAVFVTIAAFSGVGAWLALSMPLRRI